MKEYLLLCPSFADPKGQHMSFIKSYHENIIQVSIYNAVFVETPKIYLTQPLSQLLTKHGCLIQRLAIIVMRYCRRGSNSTSCSLHILISW